MKLRFSFKPGPTGYMILCDAKGEQLWKSQYKNQKAYAFAAKGVEENFIDYSDYGESINHVITALIDLGERKYHIPNYIYDKIDTDPYILSGDIDQIKKGAVKILAKSYVSEEEWGQYYFLDDEYNQYGKYKKYLTKIINSKYGRPSVEEASHTYWNINGVQLQLNHYNDYGDGDFYNLLTLEINTEKSE
jgi:hypothetical protein